MVIHFGWKISAPLGVCNGSMGKTPIWQYSLVMILLLRFTNLWSKTIFVIIWPCHWPFFIHEIWMHTWLQLYNRYAWLISGISFVMKLYGDRIEATTNKLRLLLILTDGLSLTTENWDLGANQWPQTLGDWKSTHWWRSWNSEHWQRLDQPHGW